MKTNWDYSTLADAYLKRPDYSSKALEQMFTKCNVTEGQKVCDIGAGVAHLTLHLAQKELDVTAIEPNDNMRENGLDRTKSYANIKWVEATAEATNQANSSFDFVSFGSSFNVTDRTATLKEVYRILRPKRWFSCMWNHRNLDDPIQKDIEKIISRNISAYDYGTRREDQTITIESSKLFNNIEYIEGDVQHIMTIKDCIEAWRSHGTLERQAKDKFSTIISEIQEYLYSLQTTTLTVPYTTRAWIAQRKD